MNEIVVNLHNHTLYSDGSATHAQIMDQALDSGVDVLITTDHNVLVVGGDQYISKGKRHLLYLAGEEVHDQDREPQKNHLLVIGAQRELAQYAYSPQEVINRVNASGGIAFLAHPNEADLPMFHEPDISWVDWNVQGFAGLEIWNHFSEFKDAARTLGRTLYYAFFPEHYPRGPRIQTLEKWDELLAQGMRITAVGGSDSHAIQFRRSVLKKVIFPYSLHFHSINNHVLLNEALNFDLEHDRKLVIQALQEGSSFVGYDMPADTRGFRFTAETDNDLVSLGQSIQIEHGATLRIHLPLPVKTRLIRNGHIVQEWEGVSQLVTTAIEPGAYRVESYIEFHGLERGWIFSNPIYVQKAAKEYGNIQ